MIKKCNDSAFQSLSQFELDCLFIIQNIYRSNQVSTYGWFIKYFLKQTTNPNQIQQLYEIDCNKIQQNVKLIQYYYNLNMTSIQDLRKQNKNLSQQIQKATIQQTELVQKLSADIELFQQNSKKNLSDLSEKILAETSEANTLISDLTNKYETVLKQQIVLLTENQKLAKRKEQEESKFKIKIQEISKIYEKKIEEVQKQLKQNMAKVSDLQGPGLIRILLKNERFRQQITKRGGNVDNIVQKTEQQAIYRKINQKQIQINQLEKSNEAINQQVSKMQDMMENFSKLLESMKSQRSNLQQQNATLSQKLKASRLMLMKLMGKAEEQ